jgi:hypothetical protein
MNTGDTGDFTRLHDDQCEQNKRYQEMVGPFEYRMKLFFSENPKKCREKQNTFIMRPDLVDQESELKNITRHNSRCPSMKYQPDCKSSKTCSSTFDKQFFPVVLSPENCPIIHNNLRKINNRGFTGSYAPFAK